MRVCQHCKTENNEVTSRCWGCYKPLERLSPLDATACSARFRVGDRVKHSVEYRCGLRVLAARAARRNRRGKVIAVQNGMIQVLWDGWKKREIYDQSALIKDLSQNR